MLSCSVQKYIIEFGAFILVFVFFLLLLQMSMMMLNINNAMEIEYSLM